MIMIVMVVQMPLMMMTIMMEFTTNMIHVLLVRLAGNLSHIPIGMAMEAGIPIRT